jgi:hypothetical protein
MSNTTMTTVQQVNAMMQTGAIPDGLHQPYLPIKVLIHVLKGTCKSKGGGAGGGSTFFVTLRRHPRITRRFRALKVHADTCVAEWDDLMIDEETLEPDAEERFLAYWS